MVRKIVKLALPPREWVGRQVDKVLPTALRPVLAPLIRRGGPGRCYEGRPASGGRGGAAQGADRGVSTQSEPMSDDLLDRAETRKDTIQVAVESGATHVGSIMGIVVGAVRDITREVGDWATDVFEIRDAARRARRESGDGDSQL